MNNGLTELDDRSTISIGALTNGFSGVVVRIVCPKMSLSILVSG